MNRINGFLRCILSAPVLLLRMITGLLGQFALFTKLGMTSGRLDNSFEPRNFGEHMIACNLLHVVCSVLSSRFRSLARSLAETRWYTHGDQYHARLVRTLACLLGVLSCLITQFDRYDTYNTMPSVRLL